MFENYLSWVYYNEYIIHYIFVYQSLAFDNVFFTIKLIDRYFSKFFQVRLGFKILNQIIMQSIFQR